MSLCSIEGVRREGSDLSGNPITCIYTKKPPEYLVYRDPSRVMIQFADSPRLARQQRAALAALNPLRGQINGLLDGWNNSEDPRDRSRATGYERRVADALIMGLEGGVADALALLTEIRNDIIAERRSYAETDYLIFAGVVGLLFLAVIAILAGPAAGWFSKPPAGIGAIWTGAGGGTIGAIFSITLNLRNRAVQIDPNRLNNRRDAALRMAVGTIGGAILICLFLTDFVTLATVGTASLENPDNRIMPLVLGFLAGFSERAVPNLLAQAAQPMEQYQASDRALSHAAGAAETPGALTWAREDDEGDGADGRAVAALELEVDACLCDVAHGEGDEVTADEDLPVAVGGVSVDMPAGPVIRPPKADISKAEADRIRASTE